MQRYFFDVKGCASVQDKVGACYEDLGTAQRQAAVLAADLVREACDQIWRDGDLTIAVRCESGRKVFSIVVLALSTPR